MNNDPGFDENDLGLEKALLGYLIHSPSKFALVRPIIEKFAYFTAPAHRTIYSIMLDWDTESDGKWEELTLGDALKKLNKLKNCGGYGYLAELQAEAPAKCNAAYYAKTLRENYLSVKVQEYANELAGKMSNPQSAISDEVGETIRRLQGIQASLGARKNRVQTVAEVIPQVFMEMEEALKTGGNPSLSTGLSSLDDKGGRLFRSEFNIWAGRPSMGKTALALTVADACSPDLKILFISLETTTKSISRDRLIPMSTNINSMSMRIPERLTEDEWGKLAGVMHKFAEYKNFKICDQSAMTMSDVELLVASEMQAEGGGIDLLIVDYFQLLRLPPGNGKRWEKLADNSMRMKALIKEHDLFSIILAQLNRESEKQKRRPVMSDLRESGQLEQDADSIGFLHADEDGGTTFIIAKNKNGPVGDVPLFFNKKYARFEDQATGSREF